MFADISSLIAACGQPPVSMARIRSAGRARFFMRNSWSSRVKMSLVTVARLSQAIDTRTCRKPTPMLYWVRRCRQRARVSAVFPEPTGLERRLRGTTQKDWGDCDLPPNADSEAALFEISWRVFGHVPFGVFAYRRQVLACGQLSYETTHQDGRDAHAYAHALQGHASEKPVPYSSSHPRKGCW